MVNDYKGMSLIIVPTDTPGFIVSRKLKKLGQHSSDTAVLSFENMRVPVKNRIGDEGKGFYYQMGQFQVERLVGAIGATAAAEQAVRDTIQYTQERQAFGKALLDNQWIQFKLGELLTEIEASKHLNYYCASLIQSGADSKEVTRIASMCKLKGRSISPSGCGYLYSIFRWYGLHGRNPHFPLLSRCPFSKHRGWRR